MFIEATPNGELVKAIREVEDRHKISNTKRIKFIEKSGTKIIHTLRTTDPFKENCNETDCLACKNNGKLSNCRKTNVGYKLQCKTCKERGKERVYEGESSRNLYLRSKEHVKDLRDKNEKSVMCKHVNNKHEA